MPNVRNLLTRGNGKLGEGIHAWSLPAVETCPGRSDLCSRVCYARSGRFKTRTMQSRLAENLAAAEADGFTARITTEVHRRGVQTLRIHVSGDFFDPRVRRQMGCHRPPMPPNHLLRLHPVLAGPDHRPVPDRLGQAPQRPTVGLLRRRDRPAHQPSSRSSFGLPPDRPSRAADRRPDLPGPPPPWPAGHPTPALRDLPLRGHHPSEARGDLHQLPPLPSMRIALSPIPKDGLPQQSLRRTPRVGRTTRNETED